MDELDRHFEPNRPLDEAQADELFEAFKLGREYFPSLSGDELLAGLDLCQKNGGLYVRDSILLAYVRYDPRVLLQQINDFNFAELSNYDLSRGPVVHVAAFGAQHDRYRLFRELIRILNPFGVSTHRILKPTGEKVFFMKKNVRFRI